MRCVGRRRRSFRATWRCRTPQAYRCSSTRMARGRGWMCREGVHRCCAANMPGQRVPPLCGRSAVFRVTCLVRGSYGVCTTWPCTLYSRASVVFRSVTRIVFGAWHSRRDRDVPYAGYLYGRMLHPPCGPRRGPGRVHAAPRGARGGRRLTKRLSLVFVLFRVSPARAPRFAYPTLTGGTDHPPSPADHTLTSRNGTQTQNTNSDRPQG